MSELEELPSWAGRSVPKTSGDAAPDASSTTPSDTASETDSDTRSDATETTQQAPDIAATSAANAAVNNSPLQDAPMAEQTAVAPVVQPQYVERRRRPLTMFLLGFLGLCALAGMAALGYFLAQSQNSSETEASAAETTADVAEEAQPADEAAGDEAGDTATETAGEAAADEESPAPAEEAAADEEADGGQLTVETDPDAAAGTDGTSADGEAGDQTDQTEGTDGTASPENDRQAIFRGGKVYLSGSVPSEEVGLFIQQRAEAVVGEGNVINEYEIDPTVVIEEGSGAPLYVEDVVLFEFNSVEVAQPFLPILDLGTLLLRQNPQASVTVVTRTDAVGSEEANLEVSRLRAQAIINYWLGKGVNPDQIDARPLGEEGASEDDDEETAALNRRAEFIISGLLD